MSDGTVAQDKRDLRRRLLQARTAMADAAPDAGATLRDNFLERLRLADGATVSGFWPIGAEIDPRPLMVALADRGHPLALPVVVAAGKPLIFRAWRPGDKLIPAGFGTSVPSEDAAPAVPDVLIVPLLAFDRRGYRLGYGGGYYDRTIAALRPGGALAIGVAFAAQEVAHVPTDSFDQRLDLIVTERDAIDRRGEASR